MLEPFSRELSPQRHCCNMTKAATDAEPEKTPEPEVGAFKIASPTTPGLTSVQSDKAGYTPTPNDPATPYFSPGSPDASTAVSARTTTPTKKNPFCEDDEDNGKSDEEADDKDNEGDKNSAHEDDEDEEDDDEDEDEESKTKVKPTKNVPLKRTNTMSTKGRTKARVSSKKKPRSGGTE